MVQTVHFVLGVRHVRPIGTRQESSRSGFTLLEVLVVILIIGCLSAILLPALSKARRIADSTKCLSNIHQLGLTLQIYATNSRGVYPMNLESPTPRHWNDRVSLASYLSIPKTACDRTSVFWCPADPDAQQSYSMNVWASSVADKSVTTLNSGKMWPHRRASPFLLVLAESWSYQNGVGSGFVPPSTIGTAGDSAAQRFGALGGIRPINAGRWGTINCELPYARHRNGASANYDTLPRGRVAIFFDDGHAAFCSESDLVDPRTGQSTGLAAWSPLDFIRE